MPESTSSWPADRLWVTILAGGVGSRFWPASTPSRPKQLLPLASPRPLVVDTVRRARRLVPDARIRILAGRHLQEPFRRVLAELPDASYMLEPRARGTAPVLAWAAHAVARDDPEAVLISLHADHLVRPEDAFVELLRDAGRLAGARDALVTVGAVPDRPETGYGYIQPGAPVEGDPDAGVPAAHRVEAFHEKPDTETARAYVERGHLWNTGVFAWRAEVFLEELRAHAPGVAGALPLLDRGDVEGFFDATEAVSVDVAVLERSHRVLTLECGVTWDDVGSWEALARTGEPDAGGNVARGPFHGLDARDNVAWSDDGGTVVLFGVEGLVVVRTAGVTLVTTRERASHLKALVDDLPDDLREGGGGSP